MHAETCAHVAACTCSFNGRGLRSNVNARAPAHPGVHTLLCNAKHVRLVCMRIFQRAEALDSHAAACAHAHTHTHTHTQILHVRSPALLGLLQRLTRVWQQQQSRVSRTRSRQQQPLQASRLEMTR